MVIDFAPCLKKYCTVHELHMDSTEDKLHLFHCKKYHKETDGSNDNDDNDYLWGSFFHV